jgi:hypothetical protein
VDEYAAEIGSLQRTVARLRAEEAEERIVEEYEVELRNLRALYEAAQRTMKEGEEDPRLARALAELGFGGWSLDSVYSFVYEAAMDADTGGRELSVVVGEIDFAASLVAALG